MKKNALMVLKKMNYNSDRTHSALWLGISAICPFLTQDLQVVVLKSNNTKIKLGE